MTTTETAAVLAVNERFYKAMAAGDLGAMDRLWARQRPVSCTHPGGPAITGRAEVMASWKAILSGKPPAIACADPQAIVTGESAMVLCRELIDGVELIASNSYVRENGRWRMLTHQAAEVPRA